MQTLAIFYDAYRNLNSKRMFWVVLGISGMVVAAFGALGVNEDGAKIVFWQWDNDVLNSQVLPPAVLYKFLFVKVGIDFWLSWLGTILALISTAGIFPDLFTTGTVSLLVSRPISRLRLFVTEYLSGLLFVTLQATIFTVASFLVIGLRGSVWEPGLFIAIPVQVCFFSYLFAVCVLLGVLTRSTVAALLLTLLFWGFVYLLGLAENSVLMLKTMEKRGVGMADANMPSDPGPPHRRHRTEDAPLKQAPEATKKTNSTLETIHSVLYGMKTVLPKTTETITLLDRLLKDWADLRPPGEPQHRRHGDMEDAQKEFLEVLHTRSIAWVVGTSLLFEFCVLACAAVIFCRRDY